MSDTLLKFPCRFPIKAIGKDINKFTAHVLGLVTPHFPDVSGKDVTTRPSKGGKYIAVTVTITATSQAQLDAVYHALTDSEQVLMAL